MKTFLAFVALLVLMPNQAFAANANPLSFVQGAAIVQSLIQQSTAGGTTVLDLNSAVNQIFTGTLTQNAQLPDATTLPVGRFFLVKNGSSGAITIKDSGSNTLGSAPSLTAVLVTLVDNGSANGSWMLNRQNLLYAAPLSVSNGTVSIAQSNTSTNGYLSSTDWNIFNAKMPNPLTTKGDMLIFGTIPARFGVCGDGQVMLADSTQTLGWRCGNPLFGGAGPVSTINGDPSANQSFVVDVVGTDITLLDGGSGIHTLNIPVADATHTGKLSAADWGTFNNKLQLSDVVTSGSGTISSYTYADTDGGCTPKVAPSGTITKDFAWSQSGKNVHYQERFSASVPASCVTGLTHALDVSVPQPYTFSNAASDEPAAIGISQIIGTGTTGWIDNDSCVLLPDGAGGFLVSETVLGSEGHSGYVCSFDYRTP